MEDAIAIRSNLQVIQQAYADFAEGKIENILNVCSDNVVWGSYKIPNALASGTFFGKEGVQEFFTQLAEETTYTVFQPREFIVQGDRVIVLGKQAGTIKQTGKGFDHEWCMSFWMRQGKVERFFAFTDSHDQAKAFAEN